MQTQATQTRVQQLRTRAAAKAEETAALFAALTPADAATKTEIGWTVAATAAHLAFVMGFTGNVIVDVRNGKGRRLPEPMIHTVNFVMARANARKPLAVSVARFRTATDATLRQLALLTDADLDRPHHAPFRGLTTFGVRLEDSLILHLDQHTGQVRRALERPEG